MQVPSPTGSASLHQPPLKGEVIHTITLNQNKNITKSKFSDNSTSDKYGALQMTYISADIIDNGNTLLLTDNSENQTRFHAMWLRDNALDVETRAANGQRLITLNDIPKDSIVQAANLCGNTSISIEFGPDGKKNRVPNSMVARKCIRQARKKG